MAFDWRDKFFKKVLGGPIVLSAVQSGTAGEFQNETVITSRDQVVNAPVVATGAHIHLAQRCLGASSYGTAVSFAVGSIMPGSGFYISTINSVGFAAANTASVAVSWQITLRS